MASNISSSSSSSSSNSKMARGSMTDPNGSRSFVCHCITSLGYKVKGLS